VYVLPPRLVYRKSMADDDGSRKGYVDEFMKSHVLGGKVRVHACGRQH